MTALVCPTRAWHQAHEDNLPPTPGQLLRMEEGMEVGRRARRLWPDGVHIRRSHSNSLDETKRLMADPSRKVIFEAAFLTDGFAARPDVLERDGAEAWRLIEVKSSLHDDAKVKAELIDDIAYTAMVLLRCGIKITTAELLLMNRDYRLGQPNESLFIRSNHTEAVLERAREFNELWKTARSAVLSEQCPKPKLILDCRSCDYFAERCLGRGVVHSILELPRLNEKKFSQLVAQNIMTISEIPQAFELTPPQLRFANTVRQGGAVCNDAALRNALEEFRWPAHYLDFETLNTALPRWPDVAPYEQVPTQYSIHLCRAPGEITTHREYLADHRRDCQRELAENLLRDLEGDGSIVCYSSFEKTRLTALTKKFPDLSSPLEACISRLFDLEVLFKDAYYHPDFCGRTSIKVTFPVLVKDMSYEGLAIADGESAIAAFALLTSGLCTPGEVERIRNDLLAYCKQDTLAMVRLHEKLCEMPA